MIKKPTESLRHYFVDEAGDTVIFNKKGQVLIGEEGCSNYFIVGTAHIEKPAELRKALGNLRRDLMSEPYLAAIPSMQPEAGKTASHFHAKDDAPEIRREVFKLIMQHQIRIWAIVRCKQALLQQVRFWNQRDPAWRYDQNVVYDACVKRLFKNRLHQAKKNVICFSTRGKAPRNEALRKALKKAITNFETTHEHEVDTCCEVISNRPKEEPCLQAVDYFLWALQRLYEKEEERYFKFVRDKFELVMDLEDKRLKPYGVYYGKRKTLTVDKIKGSSGS